MHSKRTVLKKRLSLFVKRIFQTRNIIIVSDHKVDHVPLSGVMQLLLLAGVIGFFSGVSYLAGSYITASSSIREKDRTIAVESQEKNRIGTEMGILKSDLVKISKNGKDLDEYGKFIVDQYTSPPIKIQPSGIGTQAFGQSNDKLMERISYLESHVQEIKDENDHLVTAIRERTDKKIALFEDIIGMTGLSSERLEHMAKAHVAGNPRAAAPEHLIDEKARQDTGAGGQGGPFIPYDASALNDSDKELVGNVDRMVVLNDIVNKLPLHQPNPGASLTGPFGKRVDPINGRWAIHPGLDLAGASGARIFATSPGKIIWAGRKVAYGNMVDIDHGFGIVTRYAHLSRIVVHAGQRVKQGQQVGVQGSTGRSTGEHLHYEVRINDRPVNPLKFLHAGEYVLQE